MKGPTPSETHLLDTRVQKGIKKEGREQHILDWPNATLVASSAKSQMVLLEADAIYEALLGV